MPQLNASKRPRLKSLTGGRVAKGVHPNGTLHLRPEQIPVTAILRSLRNEAGKAGSQKSAAQTPTRVSTTAIAFDEKLEQPRDPDYSPPGVAPAMAVAAPARSVTVTLEELLNQKSGAPAAPRPAARPPSSSAGAAAAPSTPASPLTSSISVPSITAANASPTSARGLLGLSLALRAVILAALVIAGMFLPTLVLDGFSLGAGAAEPAPGAAPETGKAITIGTPGGPVTVPGPAFMDGRLASDPPKTLSVIWLWEAPFSGGEIRCTLPHGTAVQLEELAEAASGRRSVRVEHESCSGWANADLISASAHLPEGFVENNNP